MIYCVEDDQGIRDLMMYTLNVAGFATRGFVSGEELFRALEEEKPRLILLDIMLPGDDGITILRRIRNEKETEDIPVIMATAKGREYDKVMGLDEGADDYLAKPFGMMEMVSRVKAVLRRTERTRTGEEAREDPDILRIGDLRMNKDQHVVTAEDEPVRLTLKEYELLQLMMEHPGRVFTRDQLMDQVWGVEYLVETRTVDVHIGTLRTKLGECGRCIVTVRGVGYKLEEEV